MTHQGGEGLVWEVLLPERGTRYGQAYTRPRATLVITSPTHGEERLTIPVAVGRSLEAMVREGHAPLRGRSELLYELRERSQRAAATRAEALVGKRDYSARELERKLADDGYGEQVRTALVARYCELGIVDDARYGAVYARSKLSAGWGPQRIERELAHKGIELASIPGWPDEFIEGDALEERAYALACRRGVSERNGYEKLVRFLLGKGYAMSVARKVARRVVDEQAET